MPSRTDQLHSYQFAVQRAVSALVVQETDPVRPPLRRAATALLAGSLVAALGLAGFAVWGLLAPGGSTRWREGGAVVVEKESGAKYVYLDGRLHPVVNFTSAVLVAGSARTVPVARRSLAGVPRGATLGIAGAPDALPARRDLLTAPWAVCSRPVDGAARAVVLAGTAPSGGAVLGDGGLLVSTPDGAVHLVWRGVRALVREPALVLGSLVWGAPLPVAPGLVNALPSVADLAPVPVPGRGQPFAPLPGVRIGAVFVVDGRQHAVALAGGLAPITALQAALLLGDPATVERVGQKEVVRLSPGEYAAAPKTVLPGRWDGLPESAPRLVSAAAGTAVCAVARGGGGFDVVVGARPREGSPVARRGSLGGVLADEAYVPAGRGAVVAAVPAPDAPTGALQLVTDSGVRHPVPSAEVLGMLGYGRVAPVRLPAEVVALLPAGPALDPAAARAEAL